MVNKFGRNYVLTVETAPNSQEYITIKPPFTLEFDVQRNALSSANVCKFSIYNLSQKNRDRILKDWMNFSDVRKVIFNAGYGPGPNFPLVFNGYMNLAQSVRRGVDFITSIECFDGGNAYSNANVSTQFKSGTANRDIVRNMISSMKPYGVEQGAIGSIPGTIGRGNAVEGNPIEIIQDITGGSGTSGFFIDNGKANYLSDNEHIASTDIPVISSGSGLLGTPVREQTFLTFDILFEPRLFIGQKIRLDSVTAKNYNTFYKVISLHHRGLISESVCGNAVTTIGVYHAGFLTPVEAG